MTVLGGPLTTALCGRYYECEVLCGLVDGVRDNRGGVLVLRGEAGTGKTALLDHTAAVAAGLPVVRTGVVRSDLPYAGLQQVCAPVLDELELLPGAHREALTAALGLTAGPPPDRVVVGLAVLGLLSRAATGRPLVYLVDDAQWLDPASARVLAFVGSRLPAHAVLMVLAAREPVVDLDTMPSLTVGCLRDADAAELLRRAVRRPLDAQVGERILAEARGNPAVLRRLVQELPTARHVQLARDAGAPAARPVAPTPRVATLLGDGEFGVAAALVDETRAAAGETSSESPARAALVAAWRGRPEEVGALIQGALSGQGSGLGLVHLAWAVLGNGLGRHADALTAAEQATRYPLGSVNPGLAELVEAAVRTGAHERAAEAMRRLSACTAAAGSDGALGVQARCGALLSRGRSAERGYREAVERLGRTRLRAELARTHLLYGEWLRGEDRHAAAREHLGTAHAIFTAVGAEAFAGRAERALRAVGATSQEHPELTAQETQVASLAGDGLSNRDISGRLLISPRTVEWHLRNVFTKLDIASRRELRRVGTTGVELSCRAGRSRRSYVPGGQ